MADAGRSPAAPMRIGIDFDNTIIAYDNVFLATARKRGLVPAGFAGNKKTVRDAIRLIPDGELEWQRLQGYVYGQGISGAPLIPGVGDFLRECRAAGYPVCIISHKTEFGHHDPARVNLREAALGWLTANGFFREDGFGLRREDVVFAGTRAEKLAAISARNCTHFIDDLEEVLDDPAFPQGTERILFAAEGAPTGGTPYPVCASWSEISRRFFPADDIASPARIAERLVGGRIDRVERVGGGRNSRVFRVESAGRVFALKQYPHSKDDPRDRLGTEVGALTLMERHGFRTVPRLLAHDRDVYTALLQWIDGAPVTVVTSRDIDSAAAFLQALHALSPNSGVPEGRLASEACLSVAEIERQIRARLARLEKLGDEAGLQRFLAETVHPALDRRLADAQAEMRSAGLDFGAILPQKKRSLVPSDFGFHNALRRPDRSLAFIDFEYFGWDDPAKLVADVLLHPGTPVGEAERARFRRAALAIYGEDRTFAARLAAVLPLFAIRWVLILCNEFIPERWQQRVAAGEARSWGVAKSDQLARAARLLSESDQVNESVRHA